MKNQILIVDGDKSHIDHLKTLNSLKHYSLSHITFVNTQEAALKAASQYHYQIVLIDIHLESINGIQLAKKLKRINMQLKIIFMSTHYSFEEMREATYLEASDYLLKPISNEALENALRRVGIKVQSFVLSWVQSFKELLDETYTERELVELLKEELAVILKDEEIHTVLQNKLNHIIYEIGYAFSWLNTIKKLQITIDEPIWESVERSLYEIRNVIYIFKLKAYDGAINHMVDFIVEHLSDKDIFDRVSKEFELSKDYIGKLFKKRLNFTFHEYVTLLKMEYAKTLIVTTHLKVYEISKKLGYEDTDYFTKKFRCYTGFTPLKYKNQLVFKV